MRIRVEDIGIRITSNYTWDEVIWIYPWKRHLNNGQAWYSVDFHTSFPSLSAIRRTWEEYNDLYELGEQSE